MNEGATEGERKAARTAATRMARQAGMTLADACGAVDSTPKPKSTVNFFEGFSDWMEEKEPGWKAAEAAKKREREIQSAARKAELLKQHGSIRAIFDPTPWETALEEAVTPFVLEWGEFKDMSGATRRFIRKVDGIDGSFPRLQDINPSVIKAIEGAYPLPRSLADALSESKAWEQLRQDRQDCLGDEYPNAIEVETRISVVENILNTKPAASWEDMQARFDWKRFEWERQWIEPTKRDDPFMDRLEDDIKALRSIHSPPVQNGRAKSVRRTNADKRADVMSILDASPDLSDREIARRAGVSPQTVNTWRKKRGVQI